VQINAPNSASGAWPARNPNLSATVIAPKSAAESSASTTASTEEKARSYRAARVDAGRVPEQVSLCARVAGGLDLFLHVRERVRPPEREVLQPWDEPRIETRQLPVEIPEREPDGATGLCVWIGQVVLARPEVGGIDHRIDRVEVRTELLRALPDSHVAGRAEAEDVCGDPHAEWLQLLAGVLGEARDHVGLRLLRLPGEDRSGEVPVGREADVVELNLVESRLRRRLAEGDVVVPDALVVRVRPAEARRRCPHAARGGPDRVAPGVRRQDRILEADDAPDQVDTRLVGLLRHLDGLVVVFRRPDLVRERDLRVAEPDLTVLVLDVELERVQPVLREREVVVDLARNGREGHRDVDPANLVRVGARRRFRRLGRGGRVRRLPAPGAGHVGLALGEETGAQSRSGCGERDDSESGGPSYRASLPGLSTPGTESFVRVNRLQKHEPRHANGMRVLSARSKNVLTQHFLLR
jgi:hypothetical protein